MTRLPAGAIVAVASSAVLLFALEPFVAKVLLPRMGGSPATWNTCVMVFQALLLAGYWYSALLARVDDLKRAIQSHIALVTISIVAWPFSTRLLWSDPPVGWPAVVWIATATAAAVGLPFILLSATSPLIQVWLARTAPHRNVHRLYAVSSAASVGGLVGYVAVIEPWVGVARQSLLLLVAYTLAMLVTLAFAWTLTEAAPAAVATATTLEARGPKAWRPIFWLALATAASGTLYAVNTYVTTDIAAFPLLWVIPLALFLLAFAYGYSRFAERHLDALLGVALLVVGAALVNSLWFTAMVPTWFDLALALCALTMAVAGLAAELARTRPAADHLPAYYSIICIGGVLAGVLSVVVLPWAWSTLAALATSAGAIPEYPVALWLALALIAGSRGDRRSRLFVVVVAAMVIVAVVVPARTSRATILFEARNFFGTVRVQHDAQLNARVFRHGTTVHGLQRLDHPDAPAGYYHRDSPIGLLIAATTPRRVLVLGLGVGTLAAYAQPGDRYTFLEIDPLVARIADDPRWFSHVSAARSKGVTVDVQIGDARLLAARFPDQSFDLIVMDAFASDSVPVHLLTLEALDLYRRKLTPAGAIAINVSNRFFDFVPVLVGAAEARRFGWAVAEREGLHPTEFSSSWFVLTATRSGALAAGLHGDDWQRTGIAPRTPWTDDRANLLGALRLWRVPDR
ncbi:MAG TPA: fused MFS/spermidine synthase [Vicinamibacterales bacterium]|nr:fused MFS/spermidine synthase [Vicinamibacterales bacterium]